MATSDWGSTWDEQRTNDPDADLISVAKKRFKIAETWEAVARIRFDYDYKFANGDTHNKYQWDKDILTNRELMDRPCLTINKTNQHNLQILNDMKQNKPGVRIRPVNDEASFEGAQIFQEIVYHIEYISNAENVYDQASTFQIQAGWGYWRVNVDYENPDKGFDQEIKICRIKDPRSVYLDPDINEIDGSDARWGFIFEDVPKDLFREQYPDYKDIVGFAPLGNSTSDMWLTQNHIRVAEYYYKTQDKDKYVAFTDPESGEQIESQFSKLEKQQKEVFKEIKKREGNLPEELRTYRERNVLKDNIDWCKIAGDKIIDRKKWLGKYIPIVRVIGTETVIDGELDRKGHTRALINAQQIYNYSTSADVEFGALQTKSPWVAATEAIANFVEYYKTANSKNHAYMPYNAFDEDGNPLPAPTRPAPPMPSPAYAATRKVSQEEMMMASGQYQSQLGENENAKSGVAINARQRQGDRATYHFIDGQAIAIRFTGKILIDLIPKVYDTKRIKRIETSDGRILEVSIDPDAQFAMQNVTDPNNIQKDKDRAIEQIIFNPGFGQYDIMADTGPSFATRRQEAFNALTQIAAQNKEFMGIAGDLLWKVADFPEAQLLADRWRKIIPPNITGDAPNPALTEAMHQASDKIEQQLAVIAKQAKDLADKDKELTIKAQTLDLQLKTATAEQARLDYEAETKRLVALGNSGPAVTVEQIQPLVKSLIEGMLKAGEPEDSEDSLPDVPGSRQAEDGNHYVQHPETGQYYKVEPNAGTGS
jgi:hypothetical protein